MSEWWDVISIWQRWKIFGMAEGRGWLDEPALYVEIVELLEAERSRIPKPRTE